MKVLDLFKPAAVALATAVAGLSPTQANAVVTQLVTINASNFTDFGGSNLTPPVTNAHVVFKYTFDPLLNSPLTNVQLISSNVVFDNPLRASYDSSNQQTVVGSFDSGSSLSGNFFDAVYSPSGITFARYGTDTPSGEFVAASRSISFSNVGGVPEPAPWAMLIAGFGLTGAAMRRRQTPAAQHG